MKFHLKMRDKATAQDRTRVEEAARKSGASAMRLLFPDAAEPSLNTLYTLEVSETGANTIMASLQALPMVEFVEAEAKRTLKRK